MDKVKLAKKLLMLAKLLCSKDLIRSIPKLDITVDALKKVLRRYEIFGAKDTTAIEQIEIHIGTGNIKHEENIFGLDSEMEYKDAESEILKAVNDVNALISKKKLSDKELKSLREEIVGELEF